MDPVAQQHFVQICATYGSLRTADALEIFEPICTKYDVEMPHGNKFIEFIAELNNKLNAYDHDLAIVKYPITKEEYIVFRTISSKVVRFLNHLTVQDRNYFRFLIMTIAGSEIFGIPDIQAINLTSQMPDKQMAKNRAETLLQNWKQVGYFYESEGTLFFGPRMIVELESYLLNGFPDDITECALCKKIVLWDPTCNECATKFHSECIRRYLIKSSNCPSCQKLWSTSFV